MPTECGKSPTRRIQTRLPPGLRSGHGEDAKETLARVVALLADDRPLPSNYADHPLKGPWRGFRECHLRPNLLLIYGNADASTLQLVRLGSHTQLFGS